MTKERAALLRCEAYDVDLIEEKMREGFELLGGESFLRSLIPYNSKVLLKPNLLLPEEPGSVVITNSSIFEGLVRILKDYTDKIYFGDSPGFGSSAKAAQKSGLMDAAEKYGVLFDDFSKVINVQLEDYLLCKNWEIADISLDNDVLISLPKLKTHAMMYYTGAIKNQFGCVPGTRKAVWHARMNNMDNFAKMLLDLNSLVKPQFAVLDGIVAMEGNGPRNGSPRELSTLIMGESVSAIDSLGTKIIGYELEEVPFLNTVKETNWGVVDLEDIEVLGEEIENLITSDFKKIDKKNDYLGNYSSHKLMRTFLAPYPKLIQSRCISCYRCDEICPEKPNVIKMKNMKGSMKPAFNRNTCIRCFCCQELCPAGAIEVGQNVIGKYLVGRGGK